MQSEIAPPRRSRALLSSVVALTTATAVAVPALLPSTAAAATPAGVSAATPQAGPRVPAARTSSPLHKAIKNAFLTMTSSRYEHKTFVNKKKGIYNFDCVLMVAYFLKTSNPKANQQMRDYLGTRRGYVPSPKNWARFFASLNPAKDTNWHRVVKINDIKPGDVIIKPPENPKRPGHALVVAAQPKRLPNGNYGIMIFDSTSSPHGKNDTRVSDPRNKRRNGKRSGLGVGVIELTATPNGGFARMKSTVGGKLTGQPVLIGRALR